MGLITVALKVLTIDLPRKRIFQILLDYLIMEQYEIINKQDTYITRDKPYPSHIKVSLGSVWLPVVYSYPRHGGHGNIKIEIIPVNGKTKVKWNFDFVKGYIRILIYIIVGILVLFTYELNVYSCIASAIPLAGAFLFFIGARSEKKKFTKGMMQLLAKYKNKV